MIGKEILLSDLANSTPFSWDHNPRFFSLSVSWPNSTCYNFLMVLNLLLLDFNAILFLFFTGLWEFL